MSNSEKYFFSDFTRSNYRKILRTAKENYTFRSYLDFDKKEKFILWRHDVDFSVHSALKLAQIEKKENISSTYFLLLHSELYNLLEKEISDLVFEIIRLGHNIGLHFDSHYYNIKTEGELKKHLHFEKKILENIFKQKIKVFSFHKTTPFTMGCQNWKYAGMINTYAEYFQKNVDYCSDSNGIWRFKRLEDVLKSGLNARMQVLTHPEWWQDEILSPKERLYRCMDGRNNKNKFWYEKLMEEVGRKNIDWK